MRCVSIIPFLLLLCISSCGEEDALGPPPLPPERILFVGNSYTYYNGGVGTHVAGLAMAADSSRAVTAGEVALAGYTLEDHWNDDRTTWAIAAGQWDVVVLQEHSARPLTDPERMNAYARELDRWITSNGSRTAFFMTWAPAEDPDAIDAIAAAYSHIGQELDAAIAPVGLAWKRCGQENPDLVLYESDGKHPSPAGTYLAACVLYSVLWNENPAGNSYTGAFDLSDEERSFLQEIAWLTVREFKP